MRQPGRARPLLSARSERARGGVGPAAAFPAPPQRLPSRDVRACRFRGVVLQVVGPSIGCSAVLAAMLGLCVLLTTGVLTWRDCLTYTPAWDTLMWFAGERHAACVGRRRGAGQAWDALVWCVSEGTQRVWGGGEGRVRRGTRSCGSPVSGTQRVWGGGEGRVRRGTRSCGVSVRARSAWGGRGDAPRAVAQR